MTHHRVVTTSGALTVKRLMSLLNYACGEAHLSQQQTQTVMSAAMLYIAENGYAITKQVQA